MKDSDAFDPLSPTDADIAQASVPPGIELEAVAPEDRARAEFYALLGRLYADPPDADLLRAIASAERAPSDSPLGIAWNRLIDASTGLDPRSAAQEYTDLFVGVGRSEVNLHAAHWDKGFMLDQSLADLRTDLARLGLGRRSGATMLEDHLSALCETMRLLVAARGGRSSPLAVQRAFFDRNIAAWVFRCCNAIAASRFANYYAHVAELTSRFMTLERDALCM